MKFRPVYLAVAIAACTPPPCPHPGTVRCLNAQVLACGSDGHERVAIDCAQAEGIGAVCKDAPIAPHCEAHR